MCFQLKRTLNAWIVLQIENAAERFIDRSGLVGVAIFIDEFSVVEMMTAILLQGNA
jgi:hypothetical protein